MNKFSYKIFGKYVIPGFILGAVLLFGLVNPAFVDASPQFDFSLSNSGSIVVTKSSYGNISDSNVITANLNSGTAQSVNFSQSGLPYGVSASYISSCYPSCSKTNTLTINTSASVGTFPITITATGGGITRTTTYNLIIQETSTAASTLNLWADKYTINQEESTYLRWASTNTNHCTASNGWSGNKSTSGYKSISPNSDTTYSLTCYGSGGQISKSVTIYVTSIGIGANLNLTKLGRNLSAGDRVYSKVIRLTKGDVIEFHLTVIAGSNKSLYNVNIKDIMPSVLSYMPGTTKINNIVQPDTITTTGLSLGTIYKGTSKTTVFQAINTYPGTYLTYTNTAEVTADNESKITDSASITYGLVAGAATIRTGPFNTLFISLIISLISALIIWYYLRFNSKGRLALIRVESKIRDIWLTYTRHQIMHKD